MLDTKLRAINKKNKNVPSKGLHLTGMRNVAEFVESSSHDEKPAPKPGKQGSQASYLKGILGQAKKGGEDIITQKKPGAKPQDNSFTVDQLANVRSILATLDKNRESNKERDRIEREQLRYSTDPVDINGRPNYSNEPVYYRPNATTSKTVAGLPYPVSDIIYACNRCTYHRRCERHRDAVWQKTDVSLCRENHLRMAISWDVTDPENRKGTWRFDIEPKYDRFYDPEREREEHENAQAAKRKAQEDDKELSKEQRGCCPMEPKWKIKQLAERIIEDYNKDQKDKARRAYLDPKGREYYTKAYHWGGNDPFTPSEASRTRAAHEYAPVNVDDSRVERELRVLLQAWYKSQLDPEARMRDRTTASAEESWGEKMEDAKARREARTRGTERLDGKTSVRETTSTKVQVEHEERSQTKTCDLSKCEAVRPKHEDDTIKPGEPESIKMSKISKAAEAKIVKEAYKAPKTTFEESESDEGEIISKPKASKPKAASRELTAEECKILKQMDKAADVEAEETAKAEAKKRNVQVNGSDTEEGKVIEKPTKQKKPSTTKPTTKDTPAPKSDKRKASIAFDTDEPTQKKSRKGYKSADIINDSDEEAEYKLPAAPALELPKQREGWKFAEALSAEVQESVKVVQTDNITETETETTVVVEQGTTIVKEIENSRSVTPEMDDENAQEPIAKPSPTPEMVEEKSITPPTSPPLSKKRKVPFADSSSDEETSTVPKKSKKVSFSTNIMSPVERPRKMSIPFILEGEERG